MCDQPWLDRVRERLARQPLPSVYVRRFLEELSDHLEDLQEENTEVDACCRLGEPEQVAEAAAIAYRRRTVFGRHPLLTLPLAFSVFAVSPVVSHWFLVILGLMTLATCGGQRTFDWYEHHWQVRVIVVLSSVLFGVLYREMAAWLGVGRKWLFASCAVLGAIATFWEFGISRHATSGIAMLPLQFAVPFAASRWFPGLEDHHRNAVAKFAVFALSPIATYMVLWIMTMFVAAALVARSSMAVLLMYSVPPLLAGPIIWILTSRIGSGKKWIVGSSVVLATPAAMLLMPVLCMFGLPTAVASLLYCKLAARSGIGGKWSLLSCMVVAMCAAANTAQLHLFAYHDTAGRYHTLPALWICSIAAQFVVPLVIGWWFLRRRSGQAPLQPA